MSVKDSARVGPLTSIAVGVVSSAMLSLPRTPEAGTLLAESSLVLSVSFFATGKEFGAIIAMVTMATLLSLVPSLTLYVKLSIPTKLTVGM